MKPFSDRSDRYGRSDRPIYSAQANAAEWVTARPEIQSFLVNAEQMQQIEQRMFDAGMPVAALMEKVASRIVSWFVTHCDSNGGGGLEKGSTWFTNKAKNEVRKVGVLAGPGHNGGDALVVARELHHLGFDVSVYQPFARCKPLTQQHADYAKSLGIPFVSSVQAIAHSDAIVDGWFGFGLTRAITDELAADIEFINQQINQRSVPVFSIDLPSGLHTDTGQVMGAAIKASHTACLGLWKRGFMQESALAYLGECELIDFDIPLADIAQVLGEVPAVQRLSDRAAIAQIPLHRSPTAHKYKVGHLLLVAGSRQYAGAALLSGLGAMASGVGMITLAVPESIRLTLLPQLPGALLLGCAETEDGAIASLPADVDLSRYDVIAFGPGLTSAVPSLLRQVLAANCPLLLDADGLNLLAQDNPIQQLQARAQTQRPTILTPHFGEFKRLFPDIHPQSAPPGEVALQAAQTSRAIVLLKGPRSAVAHIGQSPQLWFNPHSTPALARGGSGDVLTGLMGGLLATAAQGVPSSARSFTQASAKQSEALQEALVAAVTGAVWWHSRAAVFAGQQRTLLGVDPLHLAHALNPALQAAISQLLC
jgi:ADP-dependent NAD(P)H-hydrate dehydratase / NAD(P)H-hydrate epimerase